MRSGTLARICSSGSCTVTAAPRPARTWAIPWPIRPPPTMPIFRSASIAFAPSAGGVAAVDVDDLSGHEGRGGAQQEQQRADEVVRLAEAAERDAREHRLADLFSAALLLVHPRGE